MQKYKNAFSLVELLVVIAIIGILSTLIIYLSVTKKNERDVEAAAQVVAARIREAQVAALAGHQQTPGSIPCLFRVIWGGNTITVQYLGKDSSGACGSVVTTMLSETLPSNVAFANGGVIDYSLPHASLAGNATVVLRKGGYSAAVCPSTNGSIEVYKNTNVCP